MSNVPMTLPELMIAVHDTSCGHSSTFVELDDGRVLHHAGYWCNHSEDGGVTWSKLEGRVKDINGDDVGGAECSLVRLSEKQSIGLAARLRDEPVDASWPLPPNGCHFKFWCSNDNGLTWQPPVRMSAPGTSTAGYQDTFLRTGSGRIVLPVFNCIGQKRNRKDSTLPFWFTGHQHSSIAGKLVNNKFLPTGGHFFDARFTCVYFLYSDDDGRTWQRNEDAELVPHLDWNTASSYCNETSVTEVSPGRLLAMMRNGLGRLLQAWSNDNGQTWTQPQPTCLAADTTPAQIRTLPNGHLLCVWNQHSETETKQGYNRTRVSSAVSRNGGSVWEFFQNVQSMFETTRVEPGPIHGVRPAELYSEPGQPALQREAQHVVSRDSHVRWGYPSVLVMKDRVLIAHTYTIFEEHPTRADMVQSSKGEDAVNQKLKVLPLKWFYGGKEPCDNSFLEEAYEPAKP